MWTPTVLVLDSHGKERVRLEGYLGNADFLAWLDAALGRLAFVAKAFDKAEHWYEEVLKRFADSHMAAEAMYWRSVSRYSATHDAAHLSQVADELQRRYPSSVWATKAIPWQPKRDDRNKTK